jgi:hypothetical protein
MWDEACQTGMAHTAYGILLDLFSLWEAIDMDPQATISDDQQKRLREDLMRVLGDEDGTELLAWKRLWDGEHAEFERKALERIGRLIGR